MENKQQQPTLPTPDNRVSLLESLKAYQVDDYNLLFACLDKYAKIFTCLTEAYNGQAYSNDILTLINAFYGGLALSTFNLYLKKMQENGLIESIAYKRLHNYIVLTPKGYKYFGLKIDGKLESKKTNRNRAISECLTRVHLELHKEFKKYEPKYLKRHNAFLYVATFKDNTKYWFYLDLIKDTGELGDRLLVDHKGLTRFYAMIQTYEGRRSFHQRLESFELAFGCYVGYDANKTNNKVEYIPLQVETRTAQ